jgi:Fe-S-cluster formation regulator IscX/YfhJ
LKSSIEDLADEDGWASLAAVGGLINKKKPDFDPRNYGFQKLSLMVKSLKNDFQVDEKRVENTHINISM